MSFIKNLKISDVQQLDLQDDAAHISFRIEGFSYYLYVLEEKSVFSPRYADHKDLQTLYGFDNRNEDKACPLCGVEDDGQECTELDNYLNDLFQYLISLPNIRLYWLFKPYALREE